MADLSLALLHYPVVNKNGKVIASAVTNLDLHDISRAAMTYGVRRFYLVTPLKDQQKLTRRIIAHWVSGLGARYNPSRRLALEKICVRDSLPAVIQEMRNHHNIHPQTVATCAKAHPGRIGYVQLRRMIERGSPHLLLFGTAWGIADDIIAQADHVLEPVRGNTNYNHLSVRSAVSVILDRLVGPVTEQTSASVR